jgi:hypothetical protein
MGEKFRCGEQLRSKTVDQQNRCQSWRTAKIGKQRFGLPTNFIAESTRNALDLLEGQPADVIEAMVEDAKEAERAGGLPRQRTALRAEKRRRLDSHSRIAVTATPSCSTLCMANYRGMRLSAARRAAPQITESTWQCCAGGSGRMALPNG